VLFAVLPTPKPMHIPDGFLSAPLALTLWLVSAAFLALALHQSRRTLGSARLP